MTDTSYLAAVHESDALATGRWCPQAARERNAIVSGAPTTPVSRFHPVPGHVCGGDRAAETLAGIAALEQGNRRAARRTGIALDELQDSRQNLWRWAGDLARAEHVARLWAAGGAVAARIRVAEIEALRGRRAEAAADLDDAARHARMDSGTWSLTEATALLERGGVLLASHRRPEALAAFRAADDAATRAVAFPASPDDRTLAPGTVKNALRAVAASARAELADAAREDGNPRAAAELYAAARPGARVDNNGALAASALGRGATARRLARHAVATDPGSPVFLESAAAVAARAGIDGEAIARDRAALDADATTYPAANDLGVLLARRGDDAGAVQALRRAVGANPDYALGWFNLGVVLSGMGPAQLFAAQGSLGRAFKLAPELRDRERQPALDPRTYRSGIDLAHTLPPAWSFAESQRKAPEKTVGFSALLLVAFGLARALGAVRSGRAAADSWLEQLVRALGKLRVPALLRRPLVAVAVTVAILLYPLARDPGGGVAAALAGSLALVLLVVLVWRARLRADAEAVGSESWAPGMLFGAGAAVVGLTWTPLPVLRGGKARVHWAGPVVLALLALPLVVCTAWLDIPLSRALATAALIMAASLLTPVKPVDGGALADLGGTSAGLTGLGLAALLALGLV